MPRTLNQVMAELPAQRRRKIEQRARELVMLQDLRRAAGRTQEELANSLGIGQDTVSRMERRGDMLLSTLRRYVEGMGGTLELAVTFPNRPRMVIDPLVTSSENAPIGAHQKPGNRSRR